MADFLLDEKICIMLIMMRAMNPVNFTDIKGTLFQNGPEFWDALEPTGHAQAQSPQNFAIFASSDVCANFREFSSVPSLSQL